MRAVCDSPDAKCGAVAVAVPFMVRSDHRETAVPKLSSKGRTLPVPFEPDESNPWTCSDAVV